MNNTWNYKEDLQDPEAFEKIEKQYDIKIPEKLKDFVAEHNGASPSECVFDSEGGEHLFGAVLSFDSGETCKTTIYQAMDAVQNKSVIPFAEDPFGNYICLSMENVKILFWSHETDEMTVAGDELESFLKGLHPIK